MLRMLSGSTLVPLMVPFYCSDSLSWNLVVLSGCGFQFMGWPFFCFHFLFVGFDFGLFGVI